MVLRFPLRYLVGLLALVPLAAAAENQVLGARLVAFSASADLMTAQAEPTASEFEINGVSFRLSDYVRAAYNFNINFNLRDLIVDWHPFGGTFFTSTGTFHRRNVIGSAYDNSAPATGSYFGMGWRGAVSNHRVAWMIDLGVVQQEAVSGYHATDLRSNVDVGQASNDYRLSPHAGFSVNMHF